jgi:hypothetical protein
MRRERRTLFLLALLALLAGCTTVRTRRADPDQPPAGVRLYPPRVYLLVDEKKPDATAIFFLPDYSRAYDVRPVTFLARQDFRVELQDGQLKSLTADQDTAPLLDLLGKAASSPLLRGPSMPAPGLGATDGFKTGVYRLDDDGVFRPVH